jgi:hypothetical protein
MVGLLAQSANQVRTPMGSHGIVVHRVPSKVQPTILVPHLLLIVVSAGMLQHSNHVSSPSQDSFVGVGPIRIVGNRQ